jgi:hypothetical protein
MKSKAGKIQCCGMVCMYLHQWSVCSAMIGVQLLLPCSLSYTGFSQRTGQYHGHKGTTDTLEPGAFHTPKLTLVIMLLMATR